MDEYCISGREQNVIFNLKSWASVSFFIRPSVWWTLCSLFPRKGELSRELLHKLWDKEKFHGQEVGDVSQTLFCSSFLLEQQRNVHWAIGPVRWPSDLQKSSSWEFLGILQVHWKSNMSFRDKTITTNHHITRLRPLYERSWSISACWCPSQARNPLGPSTDGEETIRDGGSWKNLVCATSGIFFFCEGSTLSSPSHWLVPSLLPKRRSGPAQSDQVAQASSDATKGVRRLRLRI